MAEEVFQRTWVAVVEGMGRLREPRRLVSWIASVARHQTYQVFAEARRGRRASSLDDELGDSERAGACRERSTRPAADRFGAD